jgi:dTDP-glucose 4,6-dehydratase
VGRAVVAGGAGFIGSHLCEYLLAEGHEVVCVDNLVTGRRENVMRLEENAGYSFVEHDVIEPMTIPGSVDYVMHLASPASPDDFTRMPFLIMKTGSYGTHNLLELAREKDARFFMASTSEVYGDPPPEHHPQREDYWGNVNPIGRRSVYDEAKRYAETVTMAYQREHGIETRIVRIFNTYGPRMRTNDGRVVVNFICQALRGEPLTIYGEGTQSRSFTYVSDLVDGVHRLLLSDEPEPVNIGNTAEFTVAHLAEKVLELTGSASEITKLPLPYEDDPKQRKPDITKAKRVLGWEAKVSLEDGLEKTIAYFREELGL